MKRTYATSDDEATDPGAPSRTDTTNSESDYVINDLFVAVDVIMDTRTASAQADNLYEFQPIRGMSSSLRPVATTLSSLSNANLATT